MIGSEKWTEIPWPNIKKKKKKKVVLNNVTVNRTIILILKGHPPLIYIFYLAIVIRTSNSGPHIMIYRQSSINPMAVVA